MNMTTLFYYCTKAQGLVMYCSVIHSNKEKDKNNELD